LSKYDDFQEFFPSKSGDFGVHFCHKIYILCMSGTGFSFCHQVVKIRQIGKKRTKKTLLHAKYLFSLSLQYPIIHRKLGKYPLYA